MKWLRFAALGCMAVLTCVSLAPAQEPAKRPAAKTPEGVKVLRDLEYVQGGHERNKLDLYLPEKAQRRLPLLVWIHGGGWQGGGKEGCPAAPLVAKGYAVASINYRFSQHAVFPAQIEDCKAAIRWLRAGAAKYGYDPDRIGVWGASAGGHLVALLGTTGGVKELEGQGGNPDQPSRVQCVVDWFGPSDMASMGPLADAPNSPVTKLIGGPASKNLEKARKASPLTYVSKDSAPFLIMHGDQDRLVPLAQSEALAAALKKAGVEVTLQVVQGAGHGGPGFTSPESRKLIEDFFDKHLKAAKPRVRVTISKETTWITEPLREDGYVDYVAALEQRFRQGVTPENNSAVPFLKAMGPGEIKPEHRAEYCKRLGIPPLPEKGDYYVDLHSFGKGRKDAPPPATGSEDDVLLQQQTQAMKRPWSRKEFPLLADWLAANEKPMALLVEASKRPRRYDPFVGDGGAVLAILLPLPNQHREAARALTARAMLRAGEGKVDEAWEDLLACHRLARLIGQGPTIVELLIAVTMNAMACAADHGLLQHVRLTVGQAIKMRNDLARLPPMPNIGDKIDVSERFMFLDGAAMVARKGSDGLRLLAQLADGGESKSILKSGADVIIGATVDWDSVLRKGNTWYDRAVAACRKSTRAERQAAFRAIENDIQVLKTSSKEWTSRLSLFNAREVLSQRMGDALVCLLVPALSACATVDDRGTMQMELAKLALALAAYRADHGSYPATLTELAPKYVAKVPKDVFGDGDLHFRQEGTGYLLYSIGPNGKDDGGKGRDDRGPDGNEDFDDITVRMPAGN